jgi:hypothetical protein
MTQQRSDQKAKSRVSKNDADTLLLEVVQHLKKNFRIVIAIISCGNYTKIIKNKDKSDCPRLPFGKILPCLRKDYYLQVQEYKVINILHVLEVDSAQIPKWVKLIDGERYNISKDFRTNFLHVLPQIHKYIRIREQREKRCHKNLFSSKFDL